MRRFTPNASPKIYPFYLILNDDFTSLAISWYYDDLFTRNSAGIRGKQGIY